MSPANIHWVLIFIGYVCIRAGPDIAGKTEFVIGKMFKCEIIVYHNKTKSLKYENCFNVVHVSEKAHSSIKLLSIFCLMQGILLLASKKCSLTSQGLVQNVGAGMNCRALWRGVIKTSGDMQSIQLSKYQESVVLYEKSIID